MSNELLLRRRNLLMKKQEEETNIRAVCFRADGEQTVAITKVGFAPNITMQYSYDGVTWDAWDLSALPFGGSTKVYVRGVNNTIFAASTAEYNKITFETDAYVYVSGILESLLDGEHEVLGYSKSYTFTKFFENQAALRGADGLKIEAISNSQACYESMFNSCTNLLSSPELPATTLGFSPYRNMFIGCNSLVNGPSILPSPTAGRFCYEGMFKNCISLINAPELLAGSLSRGSYQNMFDGCTSLKTIRCRAKRKAANATYNWLQGVTTSGTLYGYSEYGWESGANGIPSGWTFVELTD